MIERLQDTLIPLTASLADAMRSLERSLAQIALVVDSEGRLQGALTDGDIRRALLAGASLDSGARRHMQRNVLSVDELADRPRVLELMRAREISQVPVLDGDGRVVGLHLLHEMLSVAARENWAVVMAGGKGSRLGTLTRDVPKPMLPVAGRPILERLVLQLVGCGIRRVFLSVNYLAEVIEEHFGDGHGLGCRIEYLRESEPLGTAGSLALLPERPAEPLIVTNGDLVTQVDFGAMLDHHQRGDQAVTLAVRNYYHRVPFGCVETRDTEVIAFHEKPTSAYLINAGIYVADPEVLDLVEPGRPSNMPEIIEAVLAAGHSARVYELNEEDEWIDVGRRDQLEQARWPR